MDHHELRNVLNLADSMGKLGRRGVKLLEYDLEIVYKGGVKHRASHSLSMLTVAGAGSTDAADQIQVTVATWRNRRSQHEQIRCAKSGTEEEGTT